MRLEPGRYLLDATAHTCIYSESSNEKVDYILSYPDRADNSAGEHSYHNVPRQKQTHTSPPHHDRHCVLHQGYERAGNSKTSFVSEKHRVMSTERKDLPGGRELLYSNYHQEAFSTLSLAQRLAHTAQTRRYKFCLYQSCLFTHFLSAAHHDNLSSRTLTPSELTQTLFPSCSLTSLHSESANPFTFKLVDVLSLAAVLENEIAYESA
jgi:hypothetical protein